jgi:RNA polymerase sigma factor (sigma-70 family)
VERSDNIGQREGEQLASARYPTSARLVAAILCGDERAIRELFLLYAPLLRDQARRMSIDANHRDELVTTLLDDVVLHLMECQTAPRHLSKYLVAALRNRARSHYRDSHRRFAARERAYQQLARSSERVVAESHSAYGMRAAEPRDTEGTCTARASIAGLWQRCAKTLSPDEITLLVRVGRHVPLREVADQLGVSYGAARVRLHRLRERLHKEAIEHVATLKPDERDELERFFRRAGIGLAARATPRQTEEIHGKA